MREEDAAAFEQNLGNLRGITLREWSGEGLRNRSYFKSRLQLQLEIWDAA